MVYLILPCLQLSEAHCQDRAAFAVADTATVSAKLFWLMLVRKRNQWPVKGLRVRSYLSLCWHGLLRPWNSQIIISIITSLHYTPTGLQTQMMKSFAGSGPWLTTIIINTSIMEVVPMLLDKRQSNSLFKSLQHLETFLGSRGAGISLLGWVQAANLPADNRRGAWYCLMLYMCCHCKSRRETLSLQAASQHPRQGYPKAEGRPMAPAPGTSWVNLKQHPEINYTGWLQRQPTCRHTNLACLEKHWAFLFHKNGVNLSCRDCHQPPIWHWYRTCWAGVRSKLFAVEISLD